MLVPGIDGTGLLFYRQVPLLERRYAVTTTRLRDEVRAMDELVADLHLSVEASSNGPVTLLGESFGGALALSYAVAHPERVARLVILNRSRTSGRRRDCGLGITCCGRRRGA